MDKDKPLKPLFVGTGLADFLDAYQYTCAEISRAFAIPPRILYSGFKLYLAVDNTRPKK